MLRNQLVAKGITQESLTALGLLQSFIAKVENGERRLDVVGFVHIAGLLGGATEDVLGKRESFYCATLDVY